ncbi:hypothetical protein ACVPOW_12585 [Staphylococcus aureus]
METFFAYFQTLAVSVNLYAIIDAIQDLFGVSEHETHVVKTNFKK